MTGAPTREVLAQAVHVSRRYRDVTALHDVSLAIAAGEITGLLGPNGAGKTTLLQLLTGLRRPTSGTVELFGGSPLEPARRRSLGMTPQETGLPGTLRVREAVEFVSAHYADPLPAAEALGAFELGPLAKRQIGGLSGGQKRRLAVALAFVGRPKLVLLDEPTTGLDVEGRRALWEVIRRFRAAGGAVLLTSHQLDEIEALAERVVVLAKGRIVADDRLEVIRDLVGVRRVRLRARPLPALAGVVSATASGDTQELLTRDADALVRDLVRSGVPFAGLEVEAASLEDAFLHLTREPA